MNWWAMDWRDSLWLSLQMRWQGVGTLSPNAHQRCRLIAALIFVFVTSFAAAVCGTRFDVAEFGVLLSFLLPRTAATQARRKGRWQLQINTPEIFEK